MNKREVGTAYEQFAAAYLKELGYEIVEANYRCPVGEIDLVAKDGSYLVFVEVKYRKNLAAGSPFEAVNTKKQQTIRQVARWYLAERHGEDMPVRFDVAGILGEEITIVKDAF